jgi:ribonuclease HII
MAISFEYENSIIQGLCTKIAGIDEVGCGPWAGPLVACACIIDQNIFPNDLLCYIGDSKVIPKKKREYFMKSIDSHVGKSIWYGIGVVHVNEFNDLNLKGSLPKAMLYAVQNLPFEADHLLIDGIRNPNLSYPTTMIVKGDQKSYCIAAASIIAKVTRDKMMDDLHEKYPMYGWNRNAGYGTREHKLAIENYGLTPYHRLCYAPIKKIRQSY